MGCPHTTPLTEAEIAEMRRRDERGLMSYGGADRRRLLEEVTRLTAQLARKDEALKSTKQTITDYLDGKKFTGDLRRAADAMGEENGNDISKTA